MANILLLRAPSPGENDRYESAFSSAGYHPISIPVLETVCVNLPSLKTVIEEGPIVNGYEGVIITSGRACEAWNNAVYSLLESSTGTREPSKTDWSSIPFYVVGGATAAALAKIREVYGQTRFTPEVFRGESSGTGEKLAQFILDGPHETPQKLLYLTGDKNRDTIPKILDKAGIEVRPLKVYETQNSSNFEQDLKKAIISQVFDRWWVVHFAPSAAGFVAPILKNYFGVIPSGSDKDNTRSISSPKTAAIGPVTSSFMRDDLKVHVDVTASNPTPRDLVSAIVASDRESGFLGSGIHLP